MVVATGRAPFSAGGKRRATQRLNRFDPVDLFDLFCFALTRKKRQECRFPEGRQGGASCEFALAWGSAKMVNWMAQKNGSEWVAETE